MAVYQRSRSRHGDNGVYRVLCRMQSLNKNGVSITQTPGEEKFVKCCLGAFRGQIYYQYDYRHTDGELFSTVAKTLDECRRRRDEWIAKKNGVINK